MEGFWCDDGRENSFEPGMLYECKCGEEYSETSEGLVDTTPTKEKTFDELLNDIRILQKDYPDYLLIAVHKDTTMQEFLKRK